MAERRNVQPRSSGEGRLTPKPAVAAILLLEDGRYLLQLRDDRPDIFYPAHWGLFGGAIEPGESELEALHRELGEELGVAVDRPRYFTRFDFDFGFDGRGLMKRVYFEARLGAADLATLRVGEGREARPFDGCTALTTLRMTPYDAFALFLHMNRSRIAAPGARREVRER